MKVGCPVSSKYRGHAVCGGLNTGFQVVRLEKSRDFREVYQKVYHWKIIWCQIGGGSFWEGATPKILPIWSNEGAGVAPWPPSVGNPEILKVRPGCIFLISFILRKKYWVRRNCEIQLDIFQLIVLLRMSREIGERNCMLPFLDMLGLQAFIEILFHISF